MNLTVCSRKLESLIEADSTDPEIFETLQTLIYFWFLRTRKQYRKNDAHNLATEMAGELFMKVMEGFRPHSSWLSYIRGYYYDYAKEYKKYNFKQFFNLEKDPEAVYSMAELFSGSFSLCDFDKVNFSEVSNLDFIEYLPTAIHDLVKRDSRYKKNSSDNLNLKISLLLSFIRSGVDLFRIRENEGNYVKLLKCRFREDLIVELKDMYGGGCFYCEKEIMDVMFRPHLAEEGVDEFGE